MNWKPTWILIGLAASLFAFIFLFERRLPDGAPPPARLLGFKAAEVTNIQVRLTNQLVLSVARPKAGNLWNLTFPIAYPAQPYAIEWLIQSLAEAVAQTEISPKELRAAKRTVAEFGLDVPQAVLTLQHNGQRTEILFGSKTPVGDGVYAQVLNQSPIYILNADFVNRLPRTFNDWRDAGLLTTAGFQMNRVEIRSGGRGFTVDIDPASRTFVLSKPIAARADLAKVDALLRKLFTAQVLKFVTDSPRADLESYGLQPPAAELAFLIGSNDQYSVQFAVQFGKSPTNDPFAVYARRLATTNIVLVPKAVLEAVQISHGDVRDLHLVTFPANAVDSIEVIGEEGFVVRRQTNGTWMITEPKPELADTNAIREWFELFSKLEGTVEKDVVTDFTAPYGLNPASRRYLLRTTVTNASGGSSNLILAELDLGRVQDRKVFARRPDEATVYSLSLEDVARLPRASWQLRNRRVWSFTTNQVSRVTVRFKGQSRTLQRAANASWSLVEGEGIISAVNPMLEETLRRLGELHATMWVSQGETNRAPYGFTDQSSRVTLELRSGDKPQTLVLEFGGPSPIQLPYALAEVDGRTWIFEFPPTLFFEVVRDVFNPLFREGQ